MVGGDRGAEVGSTIALSAEINNRQLHQKEIAFLKDKKNIEAFAKELYGDNPTAEQLQSAEKYLAQGGISLVDSSYSIKVGGQDADTKTFNENVSKAEDYIQENFEENAYFLNLDTIPFSFDLTVDTTGYGSEMSSDWLVSMSVNTDFISFSMSRISSSSCLI